MFGLTMRHCLRKLFNVGSLFKRLFAYNTFVPFSFTGESSSSSTIYYMSLVGLRYDHHTPWLRRLATRRFKSARHRGVVLSMTVVFRN